MYVPSSHLQGRGECTNLPVPTATPTLNRKGFLKAFENWELWCLYFSLAQTLAAEASLCLGAAAPQLSSCFVPLRSGTGWQLCDPDRRAQSQDKAPRLVVPHQIRISYIHLWLTAKLALQNKILPAQHPHYLLQHALHPTDKIQESSDSSLAFPGSPTRQLKKQRPACTLQGFGQLFLFLASHTKLTLSYQSGKLILREKIISKMVNIIFKHSLMVAFKPT